MICGACGGAIAKVSGKSGGYYGCLGATKSKCENRLLVRRALAERISRSRQRPSGSRKQSSKVRSGGSPISLSSSEKGGGARRWPTPS
jgi:hypothetical protein